MPLPARSRPRRIAGWLTVVACLLAMTGAGGAVPIIDPDPAPPPPRLMWKPAPFLLSRTLPPFEWEGQTARRTAADFEPWNAVLGPSGYYYGYVNDGAAPKGLIYGLRPYGYIDTRREPHAPGAAHAVYRFPNLADAPLNRLQGDVPHGAMAVGQDGAIYGRLSEGGVFAAGVLFKLSGGIPQAIHHFEEKGSAGAMIVGTNGDIYSATVPEDPTQSSRVFRLSKYRGYTNIPAPPGEIVSLVEASDGRIILGTWIAGASQGALWRLNEADEFELFVDHVALNSAAPHKLVPQPAGEFLCATNKSLLHISREGAVSTLWTFSWTSAVPTLLLAGLVADGHERYFGSVRINNGDASFYLIRSLQPKPAFGATGLSSVSTGVHETWMDTLFPTRVLGDRGGRTYQGNNGWVVDRGHLPPLARDDTVPAGAFITGAGGLPRVTFPVLRNDADPERKPLKIVALGTATHGVVKVDRTFQFVTYTANSSPVQNDSFTYTISDGDRTATARVFIRAKAAGRYAGEVIRAAPDSGVQAPADSLLVNLRADRSLTGRLEFEGRLYRFTRRFDAFNQCAAVLMVDRDLQRSLAIQLFLRPNGAQWTVDAIIQKDHAAKFTAACALSLP